jgi:hypothetical protein
MLSGRTTSASPEPSNGPATKIETRQKLSGLEVAFAFSYRFEINDLWDSRRGMVLAYQDGQCLEGIQCLDGIKEN